MGIIEWVKEKWAEYESRIVIALVAIAIVLLAFGVAHAREAAVEDYTNADVLKAVSQDGKVTVYLHKEACENTKILDLLRGNNVPNIETWHAGSVVTPKGERQACWLASYRNGFVYIQDDQGDNGRVPLEAFQPDAGT